MSFIIQEGKGRGKGNEVSNNGESVISESVKRGLRFAVCREFTGLSFGFTLSPNTALHLSVIFNIVSVRRSHALTLSLLFYSLSFFPPLVLVIYHHSYLCSPLFHLRQTNPSIFYLALSPCMYLYIFIHLSIKVKIYVLPLTYIINFRFYFKFNSFFVTNR